MAGRCQRAIRYHRAVEGTALEYVRISADQSLYLKPLSRIFIDSCCILQTCADSVLVIPSRENYLPSFRASNEPMSVRPKRRLSLSVWTLAALCGFITLGASKVEATCGDYLSPHAMADQTTSPLSKTVDSLPGMPRHKPCHGASCGQAPAQAPPAAPAVSFEQQDRWGWVATLSLSSVSESSFMAQCSEPFVSPMVAFRLDRPPRI